MDQDSYLYHGTIDHLLGEILTRGLRAPSYWGTRRVAQYYAEDGAETLGYAPVLIRKSLSAFVIQALEVDQNSVAEPLTYTLGVSEEELWEEFIDGEQNWQASWTIYESVLYRQPMLVEPEEVVYLEGAKVERPKPVFCKVLMAARNGRPKAVEFDDGWKLIRAGLIGGEPSRLIGCEAWGERRLEPRQWSRQGLSDEQIERAVAYLEKLKG